MRRQGPRVGYVRTGSYSVRPGRTSAPEAKNVADSKGAEKGLNFVMNNSSLFLPGGSCQACPPAILQLQTQRPNPIYRSGATSAHRENECISIRKGRKCRKPGARKCRLVCDLREELCGICGAVERQSPTSNRHQMIQYVEVTYSTEVL